MRHVGSATARPLALARAHLWRCVRSVSLSDYDIRDTIGVSTRSLVRRAIRRSDGAPVVIKASNQVYPSPHELRQLEFEFRILKKLELPGVVRAIALERDGGKLALVLEDFGGVNLS